MNTPHPESGLLFAMTSYLEGDQGSFSRLHRHLAPVLRKRLSKLIPNPVSLEDVVQSTFLRAHEARHRFCLTDSTDATVAAWYVAIGRNTALDHIRHQTRRLRREAKAAYYDRVRWGGGDESDHNPEEQRVRLENRALAALRVRAALNDLNATDRALVLNHKVQGRALAELARAEGVPAVTMRVRAHRAYKRLVTAFSRERELIDLFSNDTGADYDRGQCDACPSFALSWPLQPAPSH